MLQTIVPPSCVGCIDLHYTNHNEEMDEYTMEVLEALEKASEKCLPSSGGTLRKQKAGIIPGWNEHVKPYSIESKFWFSVWASLGKPSEGYVFENMKHSKMQYKYALRRLKRCNDRIQNEKFLTGILHEGRNIFDEIRKLRGNSKILSTRIDNEVGSQNISNTFANIYSKLYNNVDNGMKLDSIKNYIDQNIDITSSSYIHKIDDKLIRTALNKMKPNKKDSVFNTVSDCYKKWP